jgi:hypothetical protein
MIKVIVFTLLILLSWYAMLIIQRTEGFQNPPRVSNNPSWASLSDDQVFELMGIMMGARFVPALVDPKLDPAAEQTLKDIVAIMPHESKVFKNESDIKALKNIIQNTASQDKNISVAFNVLQSHIPDILKLSKRGYIAQQNKDKAAEEAIREDIKELAKKGIREIKQKIPNFPFNPDLKKAFPEGFIEVPKPTATECKRFFKCSSIYAS